MDNISFKETIKTFAKYFNEIWNFTIITVENNPITMGTLSVGVVLLLAGFVLSGYLRKLVSRKFLTRYIPDKGTRGILEAVIFYFLIVLTSLFALKMANIPLTIFTLIGGALAIGVGFGSQNVVNNFISGLILMLERPVKAGDFIEVNEYFGQIETIGMRSTVINLSGNRQLILPNRSFLDQAVVNWTHSDKEVRIPVKVGVAYGSPTDKVEQLLKQAVAEETLALDHRPVIVLFQDFGDNALQFEVQFWIRQIEVMSSLMAASKVRFRIDRLFQEHHISIAFPQRDVHLFSQEPIKVDITDRSGGSIQNSD